MLRMGRAVLVVLLAGTGVRGAEGPIRWGETAKPGVAVWVRLLRDGGDDDWLMVRTEFRREAPSRLVVARSRDRCRTWEDLATLAEPGRNLDNGLLFRGPGEDAPLLLTGRSVAVDRSSGRLPVYRGGTEGKAWEPIGTIDASEVQPGEVFGKGLWEPFLYMLPDGALATAYADERHSVETPPFSQICAVRVSRDGGATWGEEHVLASEPGGGKLRPGMPVLTRLKDGRYLAVYEVVGIGDAQVHVKFSDNGLDWPEGLGTTVPWHRAGPYVIALTDGRLLLTSCSNRISWSDDDGQTWTLADERGWVPEREPERTWLTWPALYELAPGEVLLSTSGMRQRPYELRFGSIQPRR